MELPPETQLRWILRRTATLLHLGAEPVRGLIQPTAEFFPDRFDGSPQTVAALLSRIKEHAGLADLPAVLNVVAPEGDAASGGGCASGACGVPGDLGAKLERVSRRPDGAYVVGVAAAEAKSPVVLTTALVRAVSAMFLSEADGYRELLPADREPATDLAAVLLGFGVLIANGSYLYMKGCGGVKIHSATKLPVEEATLALAVFCKLHAIPERTAARHLDVTPRELFGEAVAWASSNASVVRMLRASPRAVEADDLHLSPARSWLARALGFGSKKHAAASPDDELAELERSMARSAPAAQKQKGSSTALDEAKARRLTELRALVEESLDG
jgi:hypothetical protein